MNSHLILGGARSGKSRYAEQLAVASGQDVLVIATAQALDAEMSARIARHRADRPAAFHCVEEALELGACLRQHARAERCIVVDCLTLWLTNLLMAYPTDDESRLSLPAMTAVEDLLSALPEAPGTCLLVANEVGFGLVPDNPLGRLFRDCAGRLNQQVAARVQAVSLVVAGLPLRVK